MQDADQGPSSIGDELQAVLEEICASSSEFAHGKTFPMSLLNPCITLEDFGVISLPLCIQDAQVIMTRAESHSYGSREQVNEGQRRPLRIEPQQFAFGNDRWNTFLDATVQSTFEELGLAISPGSVKFELDSMLLHETGHEADSVHERMAETAGFITIILPSEYSGGEIRVSRSGTSRVFDFSATSSLEMSVIAGYGDCSFEVGPVTSGYRLSLVYQLIRDTPSDIPKPFVASSDNLEDVFRKWHSTEGPDLLAYILDRRYSTGRFSEGLRILEGIDAQRLAHLQQVAERFSYMVFLGNLTSQESGRYMSSDSDKDGQLQYLLDGDQASSPGDPVDPDLEEDSADGERFHYIENLVDADGHELLGAKEHLPLQAEQVAGLRSLENVEPDERGFQPEEDDDSDYCHLGYEQLYWRRTVLILSHKDKVESTLLKYGGVQYALTALSKDRSTQPSPEHLTLAKIVMDRASSSDTMALKEMYDLSLSWKNLAIWKWAVNLQLKASSAQEVFWEHLPDAVRIFGFKTLRETYDNVLSKAMMPLDSQVAFIALVLANTTGFTQDVGAVQVWKTNKLDGMLSSLEKPSVDDVESVVQLVRHYGYDQTLQKVIPKLSSNAAGTFSFWIPFIETLLNKKDTMFNAGDDTNTLQNRDQILDACIDVILPLWQSVEKTRGWDVQQLKIHRIIEILDTCILTKRMQRCKSLLASVLKSPGDTVTKYTTLYTPLLGPLSELLDKHGIDITNPPFAELMKVFAGQYLHDVLGANPELSKIDIRKAGCGCNDCLDLDSFLTGHRPEETFRMHANRKNHLESQVKAIPDLVSYEMVTTGRPHGIKVIKCPEFVAWDRWNSKVAAAREFLQLIGDEALLAKLMGPRYPDIQKALGGMQLFSLPVNEPAPSRIVEKQESKPSVWSEGVDLKRRRTEDSAEPQRKLRKTHDDR